MGKTAEERVFARLREALPAPYRLYSNVRWLGKADADSPARDGQTDLLIVHPEHGLLIVETKGGRIRRDGQGRWWSGEHRLDPPPFTQAENSKHALTRKLLSLPDWPGKPADLRAGHAVAFPDVNARTTATRALGLGPDTDLGIVIDQVDLESVESARNAVGRAYDFWLGDRRRGSELFTVRRNQAWPAWDGTLPDRPCPAHFRRCVTPRNGWWLKPRRESFNLAIRKIDFGVHRF